MELASSTPKMPLPENLRPKQREIIETFETQSEVIAKLPTGYGKTLAAAGAYAALRYRGTCNRVLYVVPRTSQSRQAAESVPLELAQFGIVSRAIEVSRDPIEAIRRHRDGSVQVFVTTIQSLLAAATYRAVKDLMQTGKWFLVIDEHHHYGSESAWSDNIKNLPSCAMLAMSATPARLDKTDHFRPPSVTETYRAAADAGFVKRLVLHAYAYEVEAETADHKIIPFTTDQVLAEFGGSPEGIDTEMLARKMRWSGKYISPLIDYPLDRIIDLRSKGVRAQMLVQAMTIRHAEMVCEQIRALLPETMRVNWVGTGPDGRSDNVNEAIINEFCPEKDPATGKRKWTLDVLVNVGMASEGLDSMDVAEVVFLTPANITITALQTIGRGARRMAAGVEKQPHCHVNVDTCSEMSAYVGERVMDLFDDLTPEEEKHQDRDQPEDDFEPLPETMQIEIVDVRLVDIRKGPLFIVALDSVVAGLPASFAVDDPATANRLVQLAEQGLLNHLSRGSNNISFVLAQKRDKIDASVSKVAGQVIRRLRADGVRIETPLPGQLRRAINGEKKRAFGAVDVAPDDQLELQYKWLRNLESEILNGHGVAGVPRWLRIWPR